MAKKKGSSAVASKDKRRVWYYLAKTSNDDLVVPAPRKEIVHALATRDRLAGLEEASKVGLLISWFQHTQAVYRAAQTGKIAEVAAWLGADESSIKKANTVGRHTLEWFFDNLNRRSQAGEPLTRRDIETLSRPVPSKAKAALADAHIDSARNMERATQATSREKVPPRNLPPSEAQESSTEGPGSGIFPSRSKDLAKTRPRNIERRRASGYEVEQ